MYFPYYEIFSPNEIAHLQGLQQRLIAATPEFDALSLEKKKYMEDQYKSAFELYKNRRYEESLLELSKMFAVVPNGYKDAKEMQGFAKEGLRKIKTQETAPKNS